MTRILWEIDSIDDDALVAQFRETVNREIEKALSTYIERGDFIMMRWYENYEIVYNIDSDLEIEKKMSLRTVLQEFVEADEIAGHTEDGIAKKLLDMYVEWEKSYSGEKNPKGT